MVDVCIVHRDNLPEIWPTVRQNIADAAEYSNGRYTDKILADFILSGIMQLWVVKEDENQIASFITQLRTYPTGLKVCDFVALGGFDYKKWVDVVEKTVSEWAKTEGCSCLEMSGRPGWEKILKNWGKVFTTIELPLGEYHE